MDTRTLLKMARPTCAVCEEPIEEIALRSSLCKKCERMLSGSNEVEKTLFEAQSLKKQLPGIISIAAGKCHFHEQKSEGKLKTLFTHGFSIDFENQEALDQFFNDPITHPLKDKIVEMSEGGYDAIIGFDFR